MLTDTDIQRMADIIVERFQPERIILFGSYANGTATEDSDVDLVVVLDTDGNLLDETAEVRMAVRHFRVPKDILVRTPQVFEHERQIGWSVFGQAERHGRLLYAKAS